MTAFNYAPVQTIAIDLITRFGRSMTFERFDQTEQDASAPWDGPADPRTTPDATLTADAVAAEPESAVKLGLEALDNELLKKIDQILIVSPPLTFTTDDLETFNEVIDNSIRYRIEFVRKLKPGNLTLLYFVGISR